MNYADLAIKEVLKHEGGYVNSPHDPGGETNYGISKRSYPNLDIKNLTKGAAALIYQKDYWRPSGCDSLPPALAICVMDYAVNSGVKRAVETLQKIVKTTADGVFGPITESATANLYRQHGLTLTRWYNQRRLKFVVELAHYSTFGTAWRNRILDTQITATIWHISEILRDG